MPDVASFEQLGPELQIRGDIMIIQRYFFSDFSMKTYVVTPHDDGSQHMFKAVI